MSTHNIPFSILKKKIILNYTKSATMGCFAKGFKNLFEIGMVYEPSVFEPLKFYCKSVRRKIKVWNKKKKMLKHFTIETV